MGPGRVLCGTNIWIMVSSKEMCVCTQGPHPCWVRNFGAVLSVLVEMYLGPRILEVLNDILMGKEPPFLTTGTPVPSRLDSLLEAAHKIGIRRY